MTASSTSIGGMAKDFSLTTDMSTTTSGSSYLSSKLSSSACSARSKPNQTKASKVGYSCHIMDTIGSPCTTSSPFFANRQSTASGKGRLHATPGLSQSCTNPPQEARVGSAWRACVLRLSAMHSAGNDVSISRGETTRKPFEKEDRGLEVA